MLGVPCPLGRECGRVCVAFWMAAAHAIASLSCAPSAPQGPEWDGGSRGKVGMCYAGLIYGVLAGTEGSRQNATMSTRPPWSRLPCWL